MGEPESIRDYAASLGVGQEASFSVSKEGHTAVLKFAQANVELRFSRVVAESDAVRGWLDVRSFWPAGSARPYTGTFNLSGPNARRDLARELRDRCPDVQDWREILERACVHVIDGLAEGAPVVKLSDVGPRQTARYRIDSLSLEGLPVIWFGKGGQGKSLLVQTMALCLSGGWDVGIPIVPGPVLICDWELDAESYGEQVRLLAAGLGVDVPEIHYRRCLAPLHVEAEAIGRYLDREGIEVVFLDSLGYACGGDKTTQETAMRMFGAIREWGRTTIGNDHTPHDDKGNAPYGSVYFENSARATWRVRAKMDGNELRQVLTQGKQNLGPRAPVGFRYQFYPDVLTPEAITVERMDVREMPAEVQPTARGKIEAALRAERRALTIGELAELSGLPERRTRSRADELVRSGEMVKMVIHGGATKYALRAAYEDESTVIPESEGDQ